VNNAFPFWVILRSKNDLSEITRWENDLNIASSWFRPPSNGTQISGKILFPFPLSKRKEPQWNPFK
jgi:hypothetical protein